MKLIHGTRMVQTNKDKKEHTWTLFNNNIGKELVINKQAAYLITKMQKNKNMWRRNEDFYSELERWGFLDRNEKGEADEIYLSNLKNKKYPLTSLAIELTDGCNLKCTHCYGKYGKNAIKNSMFPYEKIEEMLPELNELNTLRIALTGGEPTIHPDFIKIAILFLKHGFDLTILTNGYNYDIIEKLLQSMQKYHYMLKVSLDGIYAKHDEIRGREGTFQNVVRSLKTIQKNKNVVCMISTVEMRQNESSISEIMKYIQENFPEMKHTIDFAFPDGNAVKSKCAFSIEEIKTMIKEKKEESVLYNINNGRPLSKYRCSGGISQCTITSKGDLKICTAANQPQFIFKYNAFQKGIAYAWCHCGKNIKRYRKEKVHQTKDCKKCKYKSKCGITDCRMLALVYNGDEKRSSPLTCAIAQNIVKNTEGQA